MLQYRKIYYVISGTLVLISIASLFTFGLNFGIDFKGGSLMEINFTEERPDHDQVRDALIEYDLGEISIVDSGKSGLILRFKDIDETVHQEVLGSFEQFAARAGSGDETSEPRLDRRGEFAELRFESVGPVIGEETKNKSIWAIALVLVMILVYVAWAFRRLSFPLRSWQYGIVALVTLFHDIIITIGIFSLLGYFFGTEVGVPFVAALLTILGYSVNDTIVIFDRVRENVARQGSIFNFAEVIDKSVRETRVRSLNTSLTTLLVLAAILFFGGHTITFFILTLVIGVIVGTYSSLFIASPLLFSWSMVKKRKG